MPGTHVIMKHEVSVGAETAGGGALDSTMTVHHVRFKVTPKSLATGFSAAVSLLLVAHIFVQAGRFATGDDRLFGLVYMFSVGADGNIPTFYSAFALLFCSGLLAFTAALVRKSGQPLFYYWSGLSLIFAFLAVDEMQVSVLVPADNISGM